MSLDLDDLQEARHAMRQVAERTKILYDELGNAGFPDALRDQLVASWWSTIVASSMTPDFGEMLKTLFPREGE